MGHVLIFTIGNRDVVVTDPERLPAELQGDQVGARTRGAYLREHIDELRDVVQLPIIEKALRYVKERTEKLDAMILVVSDQACAKPEHRAKDTVEFGAVLKEYLPQHPKWKDLVAKKHIRFATVRDNPADFDDMRTFFDRELARIKQYSGDEATYYLALSGGTPAMTAMLLFVGSAVFGKMCVSLYISEALESALPLEASREIYLQSVRQSILTAVKSYNYAAAAKLLHDNLDEPLSIVDSSDAQQTIVALLAYAHQRLAFDFEAARKTLEPVVTLLRGSVRDQVIQLWNGTSQIAEDDELKLRDVYYGAEIKYGNGEYADFLGRVFRLHEGMLRLQVQRWGAKFSNESGKTLDQDWVQQTPGLVEWFGKQGVDYEKDVSRVTLRALAEFLAPAHGGEPIVEHIGKIERLAGLRNQTIIAHDFRGISRHLLAQKFSGQDQADENEADQIVPTLAALYERIFGHPVGSNPFSRINQLLETLLDEAR